jgi:hypothetical protein
MGSRLECGKRCEGQCEAVGVGRVRGIKAWACEGVASQRWTGHWSVVLAWSSRGRRLKCPPRPRPRPRPACDDAPRCRPTQQSFYLQRVSEHTHSQTTQQPNSRIGAIPGHLPHPEYRTLYPNSCVPETPSETAPPLCPPARTPWPAGLGPATARSTSRSSAPPRRACT